MKRCLNGERKVAAAHKSRIHEPTIYLRFLGIILRVLFSDLRFPYTKSKNYKPVSNNFCSGGWGDSVVEVILTIKEENSQDFGPNYVQEFGLSTIASSSDLEVTISIRE